ncbi:MAG: hypothetical protein A2V66_01630 [Ignavibacteria bacterium RBG_13_36_8]|nr:MAG: hypothetical protein A2V66_01630 [Ignavibacteria bacterium RBG_13_36_8]
MGFKIKVFGKDLLEWISTKVPKGSGVYNNCVFDRPVPIAIPPQIQESKSKIIKKVTLEDYEALVKVIAEKTNTDEEIVRKIMSLSGEFLENL